MNGFGCFTAHVEALKTDSSWLLQLLCAGFRVLHKKLSAQQGSKEAAFNSWDVPSRPFRGCLLTHPKLRIDFMFCCCFTRRYFSRKYFHVVVRDNPTFRRTTSQLADFFRVKIFFLVITTRISRKMMMTPTRYHRISCAAFIVSWLSMISFSWKLTTLDLTTADKRKCFSYKSALEFLAKHQFSFNLQDLKT